jgi:hypothetical protein
MGNRNPDGLVAVIDVLGNDRNPVVIHKQVDGSFESELRDGSPFGVGSSVAGALHSIADRLYELSIAIRREAKEYQ